MYLSSMVIFVLGYSIYDGYLRLKKSKLNQTVCSISAISSTIDLLSLRSEKFAVRKASIDVMRLVWVVIIIAAHSSFSGIEPRLIVKVGMFAYEKNSLSTLDDDKKKEDNHKIYFFSI